MKKRIAIILCVVAAFSLSALAGQQEREKLDRIEQSLKGDVVNLVCVDERFATGGQPSDSACAKLAANGYRAVLNLRTEGEGVDIAREREMVEKAGMRYINIPVVTREPKPENAEDFIKAVKDPANHPLMIHCGSGNRVGAFMMIYRVVDQGWSEEKAMEEATRIGLTNPGLKSFAQSYIASRKKK
jgi:uncharacterized protein (TIGR01244 family)